MSPRNRLPRACSCTIKGRAFKPAGMSMKDITQISIRRDELEVLKLCDADGLTQEEAGARMGVSRGTVQRMLSEARRKTATALSECKALVLEEPIC